MNSKINILCLPIGRLWEEAVRTQFDDLISGLPDRVTVKLHNPVCTELQILEVAQGYSDFKPDLLLLAAMHGGTARCIFLAARKFAMPTAIWCHDQKNSLASSALALEGLRQLQHPCALLHGDDQTAKEELSMAAVAAAAKQRLHELRIGQVGPLHFNLVSCAVNPLLLHERFGSWVVPLAISSLRARLNQLDAKRVVEKIEVLRKFNHSTVREEVFQRAAAFHVVLEEMARELRLDILAIDCWNEIVPEFATSACLGFSENAYRIACEGDLVLAVTLAAGEAICGSPGYCGDLYCIQEATGEVILQHCAGCAAMHFDSQIMNIVPQASPTQGSANEVVVACHPVLPTGLGTLVLLHGSNLDKLHVGCCEIIGTEFTGQMRVKLRIKGNGKSFRHQAAGNHYIVFPGDYVEAWNTWAQWSNVTVNLF